MKSLYAYFGLLDLHNIDSPGHSLYQIGLVDSLRESFGEEKFDFYSYYPEQVINSAELKGFPDTPLGRIFGKYRSQLFDKPIHNIEDLLQKISNTEYKTLYLKARFRNLSTLAKKWKDAQDFERIINLAHLKGYAKKDIIILDTDLSLSDKFKKKYQDIVTILIPSIDFPGISTQFLNECVEVNITNIKSATNLRSIFYGNINTSNYKSGNSKSNILGDALSTLSSFCIEHESDLVLICKTSDYSTFKSSFFHIPRNYRVAIWETLQNSHIMLNITKEKYNDVKFIPARIYEAMIFGMIPVSYKFDFLCPAFSFNTCDDLLEIYKYLIECEPEDLINSYKYFLKNYYAFLNK
jgi:hypothetical protein